MSELERRAGWPDRARRREVNLVGGLSERATWFVTAAVEHARALHRSPLAPDVARLHRLFTSDRSERRPDYQRDPALRRAYLGFFLPHNAVKIALLLERARREGALSVHREIPLAALARDANSPRAATKSAIAEPISRQPLTITAPPSVLDVGAGPLTGIFAAWIAFGRLGPCTAVDAAVASMTAAAPLLAGIEHGGVETRTANVAVQPASRWLGERRPDLVVLANVLNELRDARSGADTRERLLLELVAALSPQGRLLVAEPATRVHARALMALRDRLVAGRGATVLSPCRGAATCPLLATRGDWCHGELSWQPPRAFEELARAAGIDKGTLKESHLLLAPRTVPGPDVGLRLVGGPMRDAQGVERRYACGADGLVTLGGAPQLPGPVQDLERGELLHPLPPGVRVELKPSRALGARAARRGAGRPGRRGRAAAGPRPR